MKKEPDIYVMRTIIERFNVSQWAKISVKYNKM